MKPEHDAFYDLAERIGDFFFDIDSDICEYLKKTDAAYSEIRREIIRMQREFPFIPQITEGGGAVSITADEHGALIRYLDLINRAEGIERREIYFRGHKDGYAYLKKIGAV